MRRRMLMSRKSELPYGYKRCEYLESTGTQWIDTGISLDMEYEFTLDYSRNSEQENTTVFNKWHTPFGINSASQRLKVDHYQNRLTGYVSFGENKEYPVPVQLSFRDVRYKIKLNKTTFSNLTINSSKEFNSNPPSLPSTNESILLFNGSSFNKVIAGYWKIWNFMIIKNKKLILNFIPALDKAGIPCMYDTVTKKPFYNQGSGEFLYKLV